LYCPHQVWPLPATTPSTRTPFLQVSKKLLLFYVQDQSSSGDRSSPNCLAKMAVHERLVRRWVPESHRPQPGSGKQGGK